MTAPTLPGLLIHHWEAAWTLNAAAAVVTAAYWWASTRVAAGWPARRTACFIAGIGSGLVALQSGIGTFDDRLLSVHMVQHMILLLLAPLLLLSGRPAILFLRSVPPRSRPTVARGMRRLRTAARPAICLGVFYGIVLGTHVPAFYEATLAHPLLHDAEHALYLLAGAALWWPVVDPDPAPSRRLGGLGQLIYMLAAMPPMALVGAYLNRQPTLVYASYGPPSHALGISPLADQAQAGAIMWVAGSVLMTAVGIWAALSALAAEERRQQRQDARARPAIRGGS
jgi:putative membrane protein